METFEQAPEVHEVPKDHAWPLLGRVLVLPRSTFVRLSAEGLKVWPLAFGVLAFTATARRASSRRRSRCAAAPSRRVSRRPSASATAPRSSARCSSRPPWPLRCCSPSGGGRATPASARLLSAASLALMPLALRNLVQAVYMGVTQAPLLHPGLSRCSPGCRTRCSAEWRTGCWRRSTCSRCGRSCSSRSPPPSPTAEAGHDRVATVIACVAACLVIGVLPSIGVAMLLAR